MEHAAAVAQLRAHGQLGFGAFRRAMEDIHAEEPGECGCIGERHCRSSAAVDVLIAWRVSGASRMRDRKSFQIRASMRAAAEGDAFSRVHALTRAHGT